MSVVYVGMATVFGYAWWFMYYAGPDAVNISFYQLVSCICVFMPALANNAY